ncbi:MAG: hypothetical protein AB7Q37_18405 [Pyrinomonadaceae bacterium]
MTNKKQAKNEKRRPWAGMLIAGVLTLLLCLTINFRAFSELNKESHDNDALKKQIEAVTQENLSIQEEIHYLKNDPATVGREVKRFGLKLPKKNVSVPADK